MILTRREIERALSEDRETYPNMIECDVCGEIWMSHNGAICPLCSICSLVYAQHADQCAQCIAALRFPETGEQLCSIGNELSHQRHGLNHSRDPLPGRGLELLEVREGSGVFWHICTGGITLFLPRLQVNTDFLN